MKSMHSTILILLLSFSHHCHCDDENTELLKEIGNLYLPNALLDDVNSIAIDPNNANIYVSNTASSTIDIISYSIEDSNDTASMNIIRSIDIKHECSPHFILDYITSITYSPKGHIIATLIPLNYARSTGWIVIIDTSTLYITSFIELKHCFAPKHAAATSDGNRLVIACEGLADFETNDDPEGSICVIDMSENELSQWKIHNVDFREFDDDNNKTSKHLPLSIYKQQTNNALFSVNAEPEFVAIDNENHFVYITLQENNGVAIFDLHTLQIQTIFGLESHSFAFSGLDASDKDNAINIQKYANLYGLRQPDGISYYESKRTNKKYLLTANEGNAKWYDVARVSSLKLSGSAFGDDTNVQNDENLGRLQVLKTMGKNEDDEYEKLYTFGSRDFTIWEVESDSNEDECPCDYPYGLRLAFSSYDDFEQITAFGLQSQHGFNTDFENPTFDVRSDDKGPEPESITVGECSNGDVYAFIGLERVGGIMVYDITDIDDGEVYFVQYLNSRDFSVTSSDDERPPKIAGDVEPETLIFIPDNNNDDSKDDSAQSTALLVVGYKTSASIGIYSFDCLSNRNYPKDNKPKGTYATLEPYAMQTADTCNDQHPCLNVNIRPIVSSDDLRRRMQHIEDEEIYKICLSFNHKNPYCLKSDDYFTYASTLEQEENGDFVVLEHWLYGETRCQIITCSENAQFVIKDGDGCAASDSLTSLVIDGVDDISCNASLSDSCLWSVPAPKCSHFTTIPKPAPTKNEVTSTVNFEVISNDGVNSNDDGGKSNEKNSDRSTFDAMTNKGGHFAESAMFYILLSFCVCTIVCIIGCVIKHSGTKNIAAAEHEHDEIDIEEGVVEEPIQFEPEVSL